MVAGRAASAAEAGSDWGRILLALAAGLVLISGQGFFASGRGLPGYAPEWAVTLTVWLIWRAEKKAAVAAVFILGLFRDAAGGGLLGLYPVALVATACFFQPYSLKLRLEAALPLMLCVFGLVLGCDFLLLIPLMAALGWPGEGFNPGPAFLGSALASALTAPPLFWLLNRLTRRRPMEGDHV